MVTKNVRGKNAKEKLTEEGLVKFSARISIQVMKFFVEILIQEVVWYIFGTSRKIHVYLH